MVQYGEFLDYLRDLGKPIIATDWPQELSSAMHGLDTLSGEIAVGKYIFLDDDNRATYTAATRMDLGEAVQLFAAKNPQEGELYPVLASILIGRSAISVAYMPMAPSFYARPIKRQKMQLSLALSA
jgi:hypothetical protein